MSSGHLMMRGYAGGLLMLLYRIDRRTLGRIESELIERRAPTPV